MTLAGSVFAWPKCLEGMGGPLYGFAEYARRHIKGRPMAMKIVTALFAIGMAVVAATIDGTAAAPQPTWTEAPWPYPIDQWGLGKAFVCKPADCGTTVTVLIRAKVGFCNCSTGVADDEELDRISDFDLFDNQLTAQGPGQPITVAWMQGRSRAFN